VLSTAHWLSEQVLPPLSARLYRPNVPLSTGVPIRAPGRNSASLGVRLGIFNTDGMGERRMTGTAGIIFNGEAFFKEAQPASLANNIVFQVENIGRTNGAVHEHAVPIYSSLSSAKLPPAMEQDPSNVLTTFFSVPFGGAMLQVEMSEAKSDWDGTTMKAQEC
jgi:hypothetical protein